MNSNSLIEIAGEVHAETEKAILFFDGKIEEWIPWSMIKDHSETNDVIESIFIPEWLALKKGFI